METIITEWNTIIRLRDNLWLKIEEPRDERDPKECDVTLHYNNPNLKEDGEEDETDSLNIEYEYHKNEYDNQQEQEDDYDEDDE